jgi:nicotinate-nucleotide--dimethylbenzimidazole phosphoribosyltransferase
MLREPRSFSESITVHWNTRTKPPGSLGRLESLAAAFLTIKGDLSATADRQALYLFAADHGIVAENVSPYPSAVTAQMVANFAAGGAAVNVLARLHGVTVHIKDAGVGRGTRNFAVEPAMTGAELDARLDAGRAAAAQAATCCDVAGLGEMGIGNTTSAAALMAAYLDWPAARTAGPGTGLDGDGVAHKARVIDAALLRHGLRGAPAREVLATVGGFEIAQMAGFLLEAAERRLPVMLDGFITTAAALAALRLNPRVAEVLLYSHLSAEPAHRDLLAHLGGEPLLALDLRLGEGTGAILGMHLLRCAMSLYHQMASFDSAGVSQRIS